ncbi:MAG: DNA-binding domain-containing protein [Pseudomonadota bacterium]
MTTDQSIFHDALLDPARPTPDGLLDGASRPAGRRFDVYRNNIAVSLNEALQTAFPTIAKLLGAENMEGLGRLYVRQHPPASPLMMHYGADFPAFLAELPHVQHLGYLPDIARLDLAMRRSYHAGDSESFDPADLAALAPDDMMRAGLTLAPSVEVVRSAWPIYAIWRFNTESDAPKPEAGAEDVVILRQSYDPKPHLLPPGGAAFLTALGAGGPIGSAYQAALDETPNFDPGPLIALLLAAEAVVTLTKKDKST